MLHGLLTAKRLGNTTIELNGHPLRLMSSGNLPPITGQSASARRMVFATASITFLGIAKAGNANCP